MSIVVDFSISGEYFELGGFVTQYDGLEAELERIVPAEGQVVPYVWVTGRPEVLEGVTETFESSDKIRGVDEISEVTVEDSEKRRYLYRIEWEMADLDVIKGIAGANGAILEGKYFDGWWHLCFRFDDHGDVATFYQYLNDEGITDFEINDIYELTRRAGRGSDVLTAEQQEALLVAARHGYFATPRETNLDVVSDELGITQQATSERIRRGVRNIVFETLNVRPDRMGE